MSEQSLGLLVPDKVLHPPGVIGIPCSEQARWTLFTQCLQRLERPRGSGFAWSADAYIQANRNNLVEDMLRSPAQWLLMVDDDHVFDRRMLINLLDRRVDVVAPLALARKPPYFVCAFEETNSKTGVSRGLSAKNMRFEMQQVAAVGTGAILIRRHVLEALEPPWFQTTFDDKGVNVSEDITFCERVREAGFEVWLDASQSLGHITGVTLSLTPAGIEYDLGAEQKIVIPMEQIEEREGVEDEQPAA